MLSFDDFKNMAMDEKLQDYEKVGFKECHRKDKEQNIFLDILKKLNIDNGGGQCNIMDIGCGCSKPVKMLTQYAKKHSHTLYLVDSKQMLDNIPDEKNIIKIPHEFPNGCDFKLFANKMDYIVVYSVLSMIVYYGNLVNFIDSCVELLKSGGRLLIGDIQNLSKKKRFLSSQKGIEFHQKWSQSNEIPNIKYNVLEKQMIDDSIIFLILQRYRNFGFETYLLEQSDDLPLNNTREDILIVKH